MKVAVYGDSLLTVVHSTPILIVQVGNNFVVDASQEEEGCASSRLSLAVNHSGHTVTVTKDGSGGIPFGKLHNAITVSRITGTKTSSTTPAAGCLDVTILEHISKCV